MSEQRPDGLRFLSGVILTSAQPERTAAFYRDVLGLPLVAEQHGDSEPHWGCELGDTHFAIHPGEPAAAPGPIRLAFMVFDLDRLVEWLDECGVELRYPPGSLGEQSRITAIHDPDGNLVELTELGPSWLDHLRTRRGEGHDLVQTWSARLGP